MPDFLAFKGAGLDRFIGQIALTTEGIYGIPLDVSARIVFLFVLFGTLLERAGAGRFFIDLAMSLLGRYKGGPAKAAVMSSGLTGMVSGSSIANVVTCGTFTIPLMKKIGYPAEKAAAIEVAAAVDGQIMPPIMGAAAFIIAEYVNVPYLRGLQGGGDSGLRLLRHALLPDPHRGRQARPAGAAQGRPAALLQHPASAGCTT